MQSIILLHGALGSSEDLQLIKTKLSGRALNLHLLNFSGHGTKPFESSFGIEQFTNELESYILSNHLQKPIVFGYSMGGYVALNLALRRSEMLKKIICLGTKFNWEKEFVTKETSLLNEDLIMEKAPAFATALQIKHGLNWKLLLSKTTEMMHSLGEKNQLSPDVLANISIPVLLGIGDKDRMVSMDETIQVHKCMPNASMFILPESKHPIEFANTEALGKIILDFIEQ